MALRSIEFDGGTEIQWDTERGTMRFFGIPANIVWLDPSLVRMLTPLRDEVGNDLFNLLVAHSSSLGTSEDYHTMVTVLADTFEEGFLAWGRAVGAAGWGRFELPAFDADAGTATIIVRSPWELVMQEKLDNSWGCPFIRGKMIGIFTHALGVRCWAEERCYREAGEHVVEISIAPSDKTIEAELRRLRVALADQRSRRLQQEVERQTERLRAGEEEMRALLSSLSDWVFAVDPRGVIQTHHVPGSEEHAFPLGDLVGQRLSEVLPAEVVELLGHTITQVFAQEAVQAIDYSFESGGQHFHFNAHLSPLRNAAGHVTHVTAVVRNITERKRAEKERAELAIQLQQAQKMEAIGQLTGGVAHDFNNLLTAIMGNIELVKRRDASERVQQGLDNALAAANRAATLTRRLLAFSRKQALKPATIDLRKLIASMEGLLRRTLGEMVEIETIAGTDLWRCEVDAAQLENALLNLAINARDAMPDGGTITIETTNANLDPEYAAQHDVSPGKYVMVAVTDSGTGMAPEVVQQAFEPFFTTKEVGRGSGLGLSMVYGFVRQSRGHVRIYSKPGVGTSVKLYLPRSTAESSPQAPLVTADDKPRGHGQLVLVVEDDLPVRNVSIAFLNRLGYRTMDASNGAEALALLRENPSIELLFTDVVLPGGMNGAELAREAQQLKPELPVLYASGYTESALIHHGRLDPGINLVEKPFTEAQLARRAHAMLTTKGDEPNTAD